MSVRPVGRAFSPLDRRLEIEGERWSKGLQRAGVWMAVRTDSYAVAAEGLKELLGVDITVTTLWRKVQKHGRRLRKRLQAEAQQAWAEPQRGAAVRGERRLQKKMGIAVDGVYVNLREEGWKEVKVAAIFDIRPLTLREKARRRQRHGQPVDNADEIRDMVKAEAVSYCAVLGSVAEFEPLQWAEAMRRQLPLCWESALIGDAADWIDRIHAGCYYDSERIVDWYHACDHLGDLARQAYGQGSAKGQQWLSRRKTELWRGEVHTLGTAIHRLNIDAETRTREANYFTHHRRGMNYLEFCERELPVGSGVVEGGGCKGVIEGRLKRVGMRWSREGAQNMIALRCEFYSDRWQQLWAA
jgi:hypothetical protein